MDKLTDKLSSEQRDWIMNRAREHTYKVRKIADKRAEYDAINVIRLDTILNANTTEDERCPECGGGELAVICYTCKHAGQYQAFCRIAGQNVSETWCCADYAPRCPECGGEE